MFLVSPLARCAHQQTRNVYVVRGVSLISVRLGYPEGLRDGSANNAGRARDHQTLIA